MKELTEIIERHHANDAGFCRHYMTLYSIVLGMETKNAFEFGSGFSTKVILEALELTGGYLITCDRRPLSETAIFYDKDELKKYVKWQYLQKNSLDAVVDFKNHVLPIFLLLCETESPDIFSVGVRSNVIIPFPTINHYTLFSSLNKKNSQK